MKKTGEIKRKPSQADVSNLCRSLDRKEEEGEQQKTTRYCGIMRDHYVTYSVKHIFSYIMD